VPAVKANRLIDTDTGTDTGRGRAKRLLKSLVCVYSRDNCTAFINRVFGGRGVNRRRVRMVY